MFKYLQYLNHHASMVKIREVTRTLGYMVSSFPAILFGAAHYRWLEQDKIKALKSSKGNFEKMMTLSNSALQDIRWWLLNLPYSYGIIGKTPFVHTIYSDASLQRWGGGSYDKYYNWWEMVLHRITVTHKCIRAFGCILCSSELQRNNY